jgi:pimeloyl-ACP methyl ester carboxylesterase
VAVAPSAKPLTRVASSDGVEVAVHELGGTDASPTLLLSHATGFHAHCYVPIAAALADRFHSFGLDYRGHGETAVDLDRDVDWAGFGDDAVAVAGALADGHPITGFGHSMGGAALLMAAHRDPSLFDRLVLFEPIAHPSLPVAPGRDEIPPIAQGAMRRRRTFASFDAAYDNYRSKPPMSLMTPDTLRSYVDHGFREIVDDDGTPAVTLRCVPEFEAAVFLAARDNGVYDLLTDIETPCVVVAGRVEAAQPSSFSRTIAERLPNAEYVQLDHQTHFGPFSHPDEIARLIAG